MQPDDPSPLNADELQELRLFLDGHDEPMSFARAEGFITGIASAPSLIPPSEWLPRVIGDHDYPSRASAEALTGLLLRWYNQIVGGLDGGRETWGEALRTDAEAWCGGYFAAASLDARWMEDDVASEMLIPFGFVAGVIDTVGERHDGSRVVLDPGAISARFREILPQAVQEISDYWGRRWLESRGSSSTVRPAPSPGRNDPCPCGSGKKYKRCCLADAR